MIFKTGSIFQFWQHGNRAIQNVYALQLKQVCKIRFLIGFNVFIFFLTAAKESGRICWLCKPSQPSVQEVCQEGLRVHPDGRG